MKTRNLMAAFAFALCLGLGAYENFDAAYKDAQRLEKENKNPEALAALQKAAALSQADWQRYRVFATAANIHLKTQKPEEAAKQVAALQALALNQEQTIALHLLNARVLTAQKKRRMPRRNCERSSRFRRTLNRIICMRERLSA